MATSSTVITTSPDRSHGSPVLSRQLPPLPRCDVSANRSSSPKNHISAPLAPSSLLHPSQSNNRPSSTTTSLRVNHVSRRQTSRRSDHSASRAEVRRLWTNDAIATDATLDSTNRREVTPFLDSFPDVDFSWSPGSLPFEDFENPFVGGEPSLDRSALDAFLEASSLFNVGRPGPLPNPSLMIHRGPQARLTPPSLTPPDVNFSTGLSAAEEPLQIDFSDDEVISQSSTDCSLLSPEMPSIPPMQTLISDSRPQASPAVDSAAERAGFNSTSRLDDDLFGERLPSAPSVGDDMPMIDLTGTNQVPDDLKELVSNTLSEQSAAKSGPKQPAVDTRTKLSQFQCVICMDDASALTVTHCGHLYCAQCLSLSLNVEATRGRCPMCRARIDMRSAGNGHSTRTKGFWPLEIKLMTASRQGKRKADSIS